MNAEFQDRITIVTGAAGGIGRAVALSAVAQGAKVIVTDRDEAGLDETAQQAGGDTLAIVADVTSPEGVQSFVTAATDRYGRVDALANCAGIQQLKPLVEVSPEEWDFELAVNLRSVFLGLRYVLPGMYAQGSGAVVSVASSAAEIAILNSAGYVASKHAIVGLTKAAALESGAHGVRVNAVCPGATDTPMLRRFATQEGLDEMARHAIPLQRLGQPEDVADLICYLLSDRAAYITGEAVRVDGGLLAGDLV